jgi:hypothetical protein
MNPFKLGRELGMSEVKKPELPGLVIGPDVCALLEVEHCCLQQVLRWLEELVQVEGLTKLEERRWEVDQSGSCWLEQRVDQLEVPAEDLLVQAQGR